MGKSGAQWLPVFRDMITLEISDIPQPYNGNIITQFVVDGKPHDVAFDVSDSCDLEPNAFDATALTFKWQYRKSGYSDNRVLPGGYIPVGLLLYRMLPYLRGQRHGRPGLYDINARFGASFAKDIRGKAIGALAEADGLNFRGGLERVRYSRYLREAARSRVCIDLPGNGPFCFRLVEYLAVGGCIVAYPHATRFPVPLVDGEHILYVREDLSDLVERCVWCIDHPAEAREVSLAAQEYFDRYLHREQLVAYYLHTVLERFA